MKTLLRTVILLSTLLTAAGFGNSKTSTVTQYWAKTDASACDVVDPDAHDPVDIGGLDYTYYPNEGLLCVADKSGALVEAYATEAFKTATHQWVQKSGSGIWGTEHSFGPVERD